MVLPLFLPLALNCQHAGDEYKPFTSTIGAFVLEQSICVDKANHVLSQWNLFLLRTKVRSISLNHLKGLLSCQHTGSWNGSRGAQSTHWFELCVHYLLPFYHLNVSEVYWIFYLATFFIYFLYLPAEISALHPSLVAPEIMLCLFWSCVEVKPHYPPLYQAV